MKEKIIGIRLESYNPEKITGMLVKSKVGVKIDEDGYIIVTHETNGPLFDLNPTTGEFGIYSGTLEVAKEVGRELRKIGFQNLKLIFIV